MTIDRIYYCFERSPYLDIGFRDNDGFQNREHTNQNEPAGPHTILSLTHNQ